MTNDPSMTITSTSTTPAPEGSDSTSRKGKTIPLPVTEGDNTPSTPDAPPPDMVKTVGGTTFDIYFHFSQTSREILEMIAAVRCGVQGDFCPFLR